MKTKDAWDAADVPLSEFLAPCDEVDEDLYDYMAGVVYPQYLTRELYQVGEAEYKNEGVFHYATFRRVGEQYFYLGILPEFNQ